MPTLACPVLPRGHPASFQSPSWLARPTSVLVRTHPYQPFLLAPVPSRLRRRTARPRPSYLRYEVLLPSDVEERRPRQVLHPMWAGPGLPDLRDARVPSPLVQAHLHAPVPGPSSRPGAQVCCFAHLPPPAPCRPHQQRDDMAGDESIH